MRNSNVKLLSSMKLMASAGAEEGLGGSSEDESAALLGDIAGAAPNDTVRFMMRSVYALLSTNYEA
jgi:hypothetical protein